MKAVFYEKVAEKILAVIENVKSYDDNNIFGDIEIHNLVKEMSSL